MGEAPGAKEDQLGVPFVGAAGKRLDRLVERLGLLESEFAVINVIKCRPPENRFSREAAIACRPFLARQVEFLQPIMIIPLGVSALSAFRPDLLPILRAAGKRFRWRGIILFPLIHPAAAARSTTLRKRWDRDGSALAGLLSRLGAVPTAAATGAARATV